MESTQEPSDGAVHKPKKVTAANSHRQPATLKTPGTATLKLNQTKSVPSNKSLPLRGTPGSLENSGGVPHTVRQENTVPMNSKTRTQYARFDVQTPSSMGLMFSSKTSKLPSSTIGGNTNPKKSPRQSQSWTAINRPSPLKRKADFVEDLELVEPTKKIKDSQNELMEERPMKTSSSTQTDDTLQRLHPDGAMSEMYREVSYLRLTEGSPSEPKNKKQGNNGRPKVTATNAKGGARIATYFRSTKPVATEIPMDVWQNILAFCPLEFLIKARTISRSFLLALSYESTWREARMLNYGPQCPDPPAGLTEFQYADLLSGIGCQTKSCKKVPRKTYWAFLRRWCEPCLKKKVIMESATQALVKSYPDLFRCIHFATFDRWDVYQCTGKYDPIPDWLKDLGSKRGYERRAIFGAIAEIEAFNASDPGQTLKSDEDKNVWYEAKASQKDDLVRELQLVENWVEEVKREKMDAAKKIKEERVTYFENLANEMEPPLTPDTLHLTVSFQRAILIAKPPSLRSWQALKPKLEVDRKDAEQILREEEKDKHLRVENVLFRNITIASQRVVTSTLGSTIILAIADKVLQGLVNRNGFTTVADQDLIPLALKLIRKEYNLTDNALKPSDENGPYRLLLADAKRVFDLKIGPMIDSWDDEDRIMAATMLKCPLCTRYHMNTRWKFADLLWHVSQIHAPTSIGFGLWRLRKGNVFAWHRIAWPNNLPILAEHQSIPGKWDLDEDSDEYQHEPAPATGITYIEDAFEYRRASSKLGHANNEFVKNILYVAEAFHLTSIDSKYVAQIAFEFALQKYHMTSDTGPDFEVVGDLQVSLLKAGYHTLFDGFKCAWCCAQPDPSKNNRYINRGQPFGDLAHHFGNYYHPRHEWTTECIQFRSVEDLYVALHEPDHTDALRVFEGLFPEVEDYSKDPTLGIVY